MNTEEEISQVKTNIAVYKAVLEILKENDQDNNGMIEKIKVEKELLRRLFNKYDSNPGEGTMKKLSKEYFEVSPDMTICYCNDTLEVRMFYEDVSQNENIYFQSRDETAKA